MYVPSVGLANAQWRNFVQKSTLHQTVKYSAVVIFSRGAMRRGLDWRSSDKMPFSVPQKLNNFPALDVIYFP